MAMPMLVCLIQKSGDVSCSCGVGRQMAIVDMERAPRESGLVRAVAESNVPTTTKTSPHRARPPLE
jgi:hypothetical protein